MTSDEKRIRDLKTLAVPAAACVVAGRLTGWAPWDWLAVSLLSAALFMKNTAAFLADSWLRFGRALGEVNTRIILGLVFYLVLTPLALFKKLVTGGEDPLRLKKNPAGDSYYKIKNHLYTPADLEKPW